MRKIWHFAVGLSRNAAAKMGMLHACYGSGALVAPLIATQFASMPHWNYFFLVSVGGALLNIASLGFIFKLRDLDRELSTSLVCFGCYSLRTLDVFHETGQAARQRPNTQDNLYSQILKLKVVHLIAFFSLAYVGVEVTLGGP